MGAKAVRCFTSSARVGPKLLTESAYTTMRTGSHGSTVYQPIADQGRTGRENSSLDSTRLPSDEAVRLDSRGDMGPGGEGWGPAFLFVSLYKNLHPDPVSRNRGRHLRTPPTQPVGTAAGAAPAAHAAAAPGSVRGNLFQPLWVTHTHQAGRRRWQGACEYPERHVRASTLKGCCARLFQGPQDFPSSRTDVPVPQ